MNESSLATDPTSAFDEEWQKAIGRYQAGVAGGYDPKDAAAIYLEPVHDKWAAGEKKFGRDTWLPGENGSEGEQNQFNNFQSEWNDALTNYQKGLKAGYTPEDAKQIFVTPTKLKWTQEALIPQEKGLTRAEESKDRNLKEAATAIENEGAQGVNVFQLKQDYPEIFKSPKYGEKWRSFYAQALDNANQTDLAALERLKKGESTAVQEVKQNPWLYEYQPFKSTWEKLVRKEDIPKSTLNQIDKLQNVRKKAVGLTDEDVAAFDNRIAGLSDRLQQAWKPFMPKTNDVSAVEATMPTQEQQPSAPDAAKIVLDAYKSGQISRAEAKSKLNALGIQ